MMTLIIFIIIILGILTGYFIFPSNLNDNIDLFITIALNITLFSIGVGIGQNKTIITKLKKAGLKILIIPFGTIIGSLIGGLFTGFLLNHALNISLSIAAGLGWYSFSGVYLTEAINAEIGTIAFLSNVFREMLAFILIPIVAKKLNAYSAISIAGATSMDTTLPLISKSTKEEYAVISFIHGAVVSFLVPILVAFFASI